MKPSSLDLMWARSQQRALGGAWEIVHPTTFVPDVEGEARRRQQQGRTPGGHGGYYSPGLRPPSVHEFAAALSNLASGQAGHGRSQSEIASEVAGKIASDFLRYTQHRSGGGA